MANDMHAIEAERASTLRILRPRGRTSSVQFLQETERELSALRKQSLSSREHMSDARSRTVSDVMVMEDEMAAAATAAPGPKNGSATTQTPTRRRRRLRD